MARFLAVSDIHIYDYPQRTPTEKFRLYQTRTVAKNIIEAGKAYHCDYIVFCGDTIDKVLLRPYVQAEVKLFLDEIMKNFKEGFIIWGNHDIDNRSKNQSVWDSCLGVMLPSNLYYADGQQIQVGSSRIAFSNWKPEFDLSWINGKVDVLFTHATICYAPGDHVKSQVLDDSKFDLAICGDIHKMAQTGKFVSIGVPQKVKMGDSENSSGVIYDTELKQFRWIDLNPHDNLLKFQYTTEAAREGYDESTGTWYIYQPSNERIGADGLKTIEIPDASEIDELINTVIYENGLSNVHSEVLRNCTDIESLEVDFNFILTRFYCKNWRSIEEAELYFADGDKVLIRGANGSGKSSFLSAIKYAFTDNRFIKEFTQFGAKECLTEVEFWYQGKNCKLRRGSKQYGLWIDDVQINYGNKKEFEENVRERFPFVNYMDVFFFDEDHLKLIGDLEPERKSEIISKFLKLDKIDYFNQVAQDMLDARKKGISGIKDEAEVCKRMLAELNMKRESIQLPTVNRQELQDRLSYLSELQTKDLAYRKYQDTCIDQMAKLKMYEANLAKAYRKIESCPQLGRLQAELNEIEESVSQLKSQESSLRMARESLRALERDLNRINQEGSEIFSKKELLLQSRCPTCKQIVPIEDLKEEIEVCDKKIADLLQVREKTNKDIEEVKRIIQLYNPTELSEKIKTLENEKINLTVNISELQSAKAEYTECERSIKFIKEQMSNSNAPEKVELPEGFQEEFTRIHTELQVWNLLESIGNDLAQYSGRLQICEDQLNAVRGEIDLLEMYVDVTGTTGKIYEEIMDRQSKKFSDNLVKYEVITYEFRKKKHLDLASYYNKSGNWVSYQAASSGQKTVLDIHFLNKVVTRMGLLIMDEFLKSLDPENHDLCIDMINETNVGCVMLSSHMETLGKFNTKTIRFGLNDSGLTMINTTID